MRTSSPAEVGLCAALVLVTLLAGCYVPFGDTLKAKAERTDELTAPLTNVSALAVSTNVGAIKLEAAEVAEARITAEITVKAKTEEEAERLLEEVRITAEPSGRTLVVKAVKPTDFGKNQLGVDFTILAPANLALDCTTNVGDICADGFTGRVQARTDVGDIEAYGLRGGVDFYTNVGEIKAAYATDAAPALDVSLTTNVGDIDFAGPHHISANLTAEVNVGSIDTDRPLTVTGPIKKSIRASLGDSEGQIKLHTNVGSIKIR